MGFPSKASRSLAQPQSNKLVAAPIALTDHLSRHITGILVSPAGEIQNDESDTDERLEHALEETERESQHVKAATLLSHGEFLQE